MNVEEKNAKRRLESTVRSDLSYVIHIMQVFEEEPGIKKS